MWVPTRVDIIISKSSHHPIMKKTHEFSPIRQTAREVGDGPFFTRHPGTVGRSDDGDACRSNVMTRTSRRNADTRVRAWRLLSDGHGSDALDDCCWPDAFVEIREDPGIHLIVFETLLSHCRKSFTSSCSQTTMDGRQKGKSGLAPDFTRS